MKRFLIHHSPSGTWDLIVEDGQQRVECFRSGRRQSFTVAEFQQSEDGQRLAQKLRWALARAAED